MTRMTVSAILALATLYGVVRGMSEAASTPFIAPDISMIADDWPGTTPSSKPSRTGSMRPQVHEQRDLDDGARQSLRWIIENIPHWPKIYQSVARSPNMISMEIETHTRFMSVLEAISQSVGYRHRNRRPVFSDLFNMARGLSISDPSRHSLAWIYSAVRSTDRDIAHLGAVLARSVRTELTVTGPDVLLSALVNSQHSDLFESVIAHHIAALAVRRESSPILRIVLSSFIRKPTVDITLIHQLIAAMWPADVDLVMYDKHALDLRLWVKCFTPFIVTSLRCKRISSLSSLFANLIHLEDWLQRTDLFLVTACFYSDPRLISDFLMTRYIPSEVPSEIKVELRFRCSSFHPVPTQIAWSQHQIAFDWILDTMTLDVAVQEFHRIILPECLKMFFKGMIILPDTQWSVAALWLRYLTSKVVLDVETFWSLKPSSTSSYYREINYLGFLLQICSMIFTGPARETESAYQIICNMIYWIGRDDLSELQRTNFKTLSYLLITSILRYPAFDLVCRIPELYYHRLAWISYQFLHNMLGDTPPLHSIVAALRMSLPPVKLHTATPLCYGPVIESNPASIGIGDCRQLAVLALMHDPDLPRNEYIRGLIQHLDSIDPTPVRTLTWVASDPKLYRKFLGSKTDAEVAHLESGNCFFSLADFIMYVHPSAPDDPDGETICLMCLAYFSQNMKCVRLSCGHRFCLQCICVWFNLRPSCPKCGAVHAHRLTRDRFRALIAPLRELISTGIRIPDVWTSWKQM